MIMVIIDIMVIRSMESYIMLTLKNIAECGIFFNPCDDIEDYSDGMIMNVGCLLDILNRDEF